MDETSLREGYKRGKGNALRNHAVNGENYFRIILNVYECGSPVGAGEKNNADHSFEPPQTRYEGV